MLVTGEGSRSLHRFNTTTRTEDGTVSLGPSPVFNHPMPAGNHRVTVKGGGNSKTVVVQVSAGQLTTQNITMN